MRSSGFFGLGLTILSIAACASATLADRNGEVPHRVLGVSVVALAPDSLPAPGSTPDYGMVVAVVQAGSAAASSGIAVGDILLSLDGEPILLKGDIQRIVTGRADGAIVSVHLIRNGVTMDLATQL